MDADVREYKGYKIRIMRDDSPESPREWDNRNILGTMVCWHRRHTLGDKHDFSAPDDFREWLKENPSEVLSLYLLDHSGITMSTGSFGDPWDSGQVGWIYITHKRIREEYGKLTKKNKATARGCMEQEVKTYDDYLTGEVYGWAVIAPNGEELASCWGYFGCPDDKSYIMDEARRQVDWHLKELKRQKRETLARWKKLYPELT